MAIDIETFLNKVAHPATRRCVEYRDVPPLVVSNRLKNDDIAVLKSLLCVAGSWQDMKSGLFEEPSHLIGVGSAEKLGATTRERIVYRVCTKSGLSWDHMVK